MKHMLDEKRPSIPTCCVTGAVPGDGGACGDCDPCIGGEAFVPEPVKRLIAEKNSVLYRVGELSDEIERLRAALTELVRACVRYDEKPDSSIAVAVYQHAKERAQAVLGTDEQKAAKETS